MKKHLRHKIHNLKLIPAIVLVGLMFVAVSLLYESYLKITQPLDGYPQSSLNIKEADIVVRDPAMRGLSYQSETINLASGPAKRYLIRDNNTSFFNRCSYPAAIWPVDEETARSAINGVDETIRAQYKQIHNKWYRVWLGTYWQSDCASALDEDDLYIINIQDYIISNLEAL